VATATPAPVATFEPTFVTAIDGTCAPPYTVKYTASGLLYVVGDGAAYGAAQAARCYRTLETASAAGGQLPTPVPSPSPTPAPTPIPRFLDVSAAKQKECPGGLPIKVDFQGGVHIPGNSDYKTTSSWRCYDAEPHAEQDRLDNYLPAPNDARPTLDASIEFSVALADIPAEAGSYKEGFGGFVRFSQGGPAYENVDKPTKGIEGFNVNVQRNLNIAVAKKLFPRPGQDGSIDISERTSSEFDGFVVYDGPRTTRVPYPGALGPDEEVQVFRTTLTYGSLGNRVVYFEDDYRYYLRHGTTTAQLGFSIALGRAEQLGAGAPVDDTAFRRNAELIVAQQLRLLRGVDGEH
jgi:hypothetical protein